MKAVVQRVKEASIVVDGRQISSINGGLLVLLGVAGGDSEKESEFLARKITQMRIFPDQEGKMNRSLADTGGEVLVVSQFTLIADWRKGRRPGFSRAARPDEGERLYEDFVHRVKEIGIPVATGEFGADMKVSLVNDGPVTLVLDTEES